MSGFRLSKRSMALLVPVTAAACVAALGPVSAGAVPVPGTTASLRHLSTSDVAKLAHADAHPARNAMTASQVASERSSRKGLPSFSSSFTVDNVTYPYTMLGADPSSGRTTTLKTVVVPLRLQFVGFDGVPPVVTFEPRRAVRNMLRSPIFNDASFANGRGQFGDQLQRATFWNRMDPRKRWHTLMAEPEMDRTRTIQVTPAHGELFTAGPNDTIIGNMHIDDFDAQLHAILPSLHLKADETPLFITDSAIADALGYHDAFLVPDGHGGQRIQTLMWSSWLDINDFGPLLADVSTLNHEVAEWLNDPFINNEAPLWAFPPFNQVCGDNPYVEVGDPQGNGPDYDQFPTVVVRTHGFDYHLQDIALLQWFTRETPSSAYHGWYDFPATDQLTSPSVDCPV
jgi:hypothetical protein